MRGHNYVALEDLRRYSYRLAVFSHITDEDIAQGDRVKAEALINRERIHKGRRVYQR